MKQIVQCPQCGKRLKVVASFVGKTGRCPGCRNTFEIMPGKETHTDSPGEKAQTDTVGREARKGQPESNIIQRISEGIQQLGIVGVIAWISLACIVVYVLAKSNIMPRLYGDKWVLLLVAVFTLPLLTRFFVGPIGKGWAIGIAAVFLVIDFLIIAVHGSSTRQDGAFHSAFVVAFVSYAILRAGGRKSKVVNKRLDRNAAP